MLIFIGMALLIVCLILLQWQRAKHQRQREAAERVRKTNLYARLYPLLMEAGEKPIEQITVRDDAVILRLLRPSREIHFHYEAQGFDAPTQAGRLALAQAMATDLPALADTDRYSFQSRKRRLPNGERSVWYEYLLTMEEKQRILNSPSARARVPQA